MYQTKIFNEKIDFLIYKWKFDFIFHEKTYIVQAFPDPAILDSRCSNDYTEIIGRYLS